jgi:hypothetical protein
MISEEDFQAAAETADPELAFVRLESRFRQALSENLNNIDGNYAYRAAVIEYMNHTIAAAQYLGLDFLDFFELPTPDDNDINETHRKFTTVIDAFRVRVQLQNVRKPIEFSVGLSATDKDKLRFFVGQMKTIIDEANLTPEKREALFNKLNKFLEEVDRNRASWERFADLVVTVASVGGEAAKKLQPLRELIDSIARLLGHNKDIENSRPRLPKSEQGKIEDKRPTQTKAQSKPMPRKRGEMDDEIPF